MNDEIRRFNEVTKLRADLKDAQEKLESMVEGVVRATYKNEELREQVERLQEENEHFRITINAENDRLERNNALEKEVERLKALCAEQEKWLNVYRTNCNGTIISTEG